MGRIFRAVEKAAKEEREKTIRDVPVRTAVEEIAEPKREETPPPQREDRLEVERPLIQEERSMLTAPPDSIAVGEIAKPKRGETPPPQREDRLEVKGSLIQKERPLLTVPPDSFPVEEIAEPKGEEIPPLRREKRLEVVRPLIQEEEPMLIAPPDSFAADQFRKLKTQIFHWAPNPLRTILITSSVPDEGKSIVAFNLATTISQEIHKKAILVDADLRNPSIHLKCQGGVKGLSNYLLDGTPLAEMLIRYEENFWIVPAGPPSRQSSELIGTKKMVEFISSLRECGDESFIVIDSPPILLTTDSVLLSKMVDGIVMVIMADRTPKESVRRAIHSVDRNKIIGIVLNQIEKESLSYYTKYYHKYYHQQDPSKLGRGGRNPIKRIGKMWRQ
jgi:protein-tyrosine kinase